MKINKYIKRGVADLILCLIIILSIFPFIYMFIMSFKSTTNAADISISISKLSLLQYRKIFALENFGKYIFNSVFVAVAGVVLTVIVCSLAGYAFAKLNFKGNDKIFLIMVLTLMVPSEVIVAPLFLIVKHMNMLNTYWALILTYLIFTLPYAILMTTGYFNTLPKELDEAVMIDGGSRFKALWKILVPTSVPGLVSVGMYTFMQAWNEYLFALALTKTNNMRTVPVGINLLMGQHAYEWSQMMAMSVLGSLPILVLFLFFQRYFIAGMTAGSVKN